MSRHACNGTSCERRSRIDDDNDDDDDDDDIEYDVIATRTTTTTRYLFMLMLFWMMMMMMMTTMIVTIGRCDFPSRHVHKLSNLTQLVSTVASYPPRHVTRTVTGDGKSHTNA